MRRSLIIDILPRDRMRYDTAGDYFIADGALVFQIADSGNDVWNRLVLIHELIEHLLIEKAGIPIEVIDAYDMAYSGEGEPGDEADCPYREAHSVATGVERLLCGLLGIHWASYDKEMIG